MKIIQEFSEQLEDTWNVKIIQTWYWLKVLYHNNFEENY